MPVWTNESVALRATDKVAPRSGAALATPNSRFERLTN